jgi:predicted transcriptional regulator
MNQLISNVDLGLMNGQVFAAQNLDRIFDLVELRASIAPMTPREIAKLAIESYVAGQAATPGAYDVTAATNTKAHPEMISDPKSTYSAEELTKMVKDSIQFDHLVCLETGKKFSMLRRHLRESFGMSPAEYRARWGLPTDYPMTAPGYSLQKAAAAKNSGLGKHARKPEAVS